MTERRTVFGEAFSRRVHAHFATHRSDAAAGASVRLASLPDVATIEALVEAAFWASLRREEVYVPKISLAFVAPDDVEHPLRFEQPLPLDPHALTRVAPAVERAGIHLGVWGPPEDLRVWGTTRAIPPLCFVLEVAAPGLLVIKHHRGVEAGKFVNVAVLEGDRAKVIDEEARSLPDCPPLLQSLLGFDSPASWIDSVNVLVQLAASMRAHGRGGTLLVVPADSAAWLESMVRPMPYAVSPTFGELGEISRVPVEERRRRTWQQALARAVDAIAGLTAVDGATIINARYELLAFGAKISRRRGSPQVEQIMLTEPVEGSVASLVDPVQLGGTRHFSAAQFTHDQREATALVASQDGRFTVFAWSPCEETVHAHRVEVLLL